MSTATPPLPIRPLPSEVISRIRSTIAIPTLPSAVSELLQNALDASASQLTLTLNPHRPSFTLTDNGHGILPSELPSVGFIYSTSKYPPSQRFFGSRGEALAALAQHSILTITSRAAGWGCTRQIRHSYGERIFEGPAPEYAELPEPGTTVRVEGLWGNMPVRLKAREGIDMEREWEILSRTVVGVLVSGRAQGVGLVVRDENGSRKLSVKGGTPREEPWDYAVLRQIFGVDLVADKEAWEYVKAKQNGTRIEGWICCTGAGTKAVQFLAVNGFPLAGGETELHREVNRIFSDSNFGAVEEDSKVGKRGGPRKGVERRGMFVLRIECRRDGIGVLGGEGGTEGKAGVEGENLNSVIRLLQKLVYEYLKTHFYKPLVIGTTMSRSGKEPPQLSPAIPKLLTKQSTQSNSSTPVPTLENGEATASHRPSLMDLENWSRIKVAKHDIAEVSGRNTAGRSKALAPQKTPASRPSAAPTHTSEMHNDNEVMQWHDSTSGKTYLDNSRTGNTTLAHTPTTGTKRSISTRPSSQRLSIPQPKRSKSTEPPSPTSYIATLLRKWPNPTFALTELPIPSMPSEAAFVHHNCYNLTIPFSSITSERLGKLTKSGLSNAKIIAQVEQKYILVLLRGTFASHSTEEPELLVVIDQHAASERIRVEELFHELCTTSPEVLQKPLVFALTPSDSTLLTRFQTYFETWGIVYTVSDGKLVLTSLPRVAVPRCVAEPELAISLVRSHMYHLSESSIRGGGSGDWVARLPFAPQVLVEMMNSRACRGAVMFNDPLSVEECEKLVERLAGCRWPFMCAHGRVGVRPLVEVARDGWKGDAGGGFRDRFSRWKEGGFRGLSRREGR